MSKGATPQRCYCYISEADRMRMIKTAGVLAAFVLLFGPANQTVFAGSHGGGGGGGGSAASAGSGGGGAHASGGGGGTAPHGGFSSAGPHFYISPRYYSGGNNYRPITTYGHGYRTFNYPAVRGTTVPIHGSITHTNGTQHLRVHHNLTTQNDQTTNHQMSTNAQVGKWSHNNAVGKSKLDPQTSARLRHWNGKIDSPAEARRNQEEFQHGHHDHDWWRHHCAAIIFFDWGWWGWYDGWWYPAWGYDPYYYYYAYDQPIYGYDGLPPDQVIANVQSALQERGYFRNAIDGTMGPLTRAAIADYQRDHQLPITGDIDPATLASLGLN